MDPSIELTGTARAQWDTLAPILTARPKIRATDLDMLAAYCVAYGRWADAESFLSTPGHAVLTIRDDKGNIKSHGPAPQLVISERASKEMARLARLLRI